MAVGTIKKDPQDIIYRGLDWTDVLDKIGGGVAIASSVWSAPAGITIGEYNTFSGAKTKVKISGGETGEAYDIINHVVLTDTQEYDRSLHVVVEQL